MSHHEEGEGDVGVSVCECAPQEVLEHGVILILTSTVVSCQVHFFLTQTVVVKKIVQPTDHHIRTHPLCSHQPHPSRS